MAISRLASQDNSNTSATTSVSVSYPGATTPNNLLICTISCNDGTTAGFTGPSGWTRRTSIVNGANTEILYLYDKIANSSEISVAATDTNASIMQIHIYEYTGNATASYNDGSAVTSTDAGSTQSSLKTSNLTTSNANDLLFATWATGGGDGGGESVDSSFGLRQVTNRLIDGDRIVAATNTYSVTASWTTARRCASILAAYKAADASKLNTGIAAYQAIKKASNW